MRRTWGWRKVTVAGAVVGLVMLLLAGAALAANGDPDPGFNGGLPVTVSGPPGSVTRAQGVVRQADGKLVLVASTDTGDGSGHGVWLIERFGTDGQLDQSFGSGGTVSLNLGGVPTGVVVQPSDQKILIGGSGGPGVEFVRLNTDGNLDKSFGGSGEVSLSRKDMTATATGAVALDSSGNAYLAAYGSQNSNHMGLLASVEESGSPNAWAPGGLLVVDTVTGNVDISFSGVAVSGSQVFVAGLVASASTQGLVEAVNASDGSPVSGFGSDGRFIEGCCDSFDGLLLAADGKLKATGQGGIGAVIASFNTSGSDPTDTAFGNRGQVIVGDGGVDQPRYALGITEENGELFAAATTLASGGGQQVSLVGVDEKTGALDTGLGPGGFRAYSYGYVSNATAIAALPGSVAIAGAIQQTSGARDRGLLGVFDVQQAPPPPPPPPPPPAPSPPPPSPSNPCSIQPTPRPSPSLQRPCADMQITGVTPGLYVPNDRGEENLYRGRALQIHPLPILVEATNKYSDFKRHEYWRVGEDIEFKVSLRNNGDDPVRFKTEVPAGFTYVGELVFSTATARPHSLDKVLKQGELPSSLGAHQSAELVFRGKLRKLGSLTFAASVTGSPIDPIPSNNSTSATVTVKPREASRHVGYTDGKIVGSSYIALKSADVTAATRRSGGPIQIAVLRIRGKRCQWLENRRGKLERGTRAKPCAAPVWLTTRSKGSKWWYTLANAPPRGPYIVLVRRRGVPALEFGRKLGNVFRLRLRQEIRPGSPA